MEDEQTTKEFAERSKKVWAKIMKKVSRGAVLGKSVTLTPEEVRLMFLSFDDPED